MDNYTFDFDAPQPEEPSSALDDTNVTEYLEPEDAEPENALVTSDQITRIVALRDATLSQIFESYERQLQAVHDRKHAYASIAHLLGDYYIETPNRVAHELERIGGEFNLDLVKEERRKLLDAQIWAGLMQQTQMDRLLDAKGKKEFRDSLGSETPEITVANVRATFERLHQDKDLLLKRGLANAFVGLDKRFKSHDGFKIGSRVIIDHLMGEYGHMPEHKRNTLIDVERVLAVLDGKEDGGESITGGIRKNRSSLRPNKTNHESEYFRMTIFKNGNAHLWFTRKDLIEKANQLLAEYYGSVVPDAAEHGMSDGEFQTKSTLPAKNLSFYASPSAVVEELLDDIYLREGTTVLEPSAGDGAIVRPMLEKGARVTAVEYAAERANIMRSIRSANLTVLQQNFLELEPREEFDFVIMNPPFYGNHYMNHVRHAFDFLRPGGRLRAVVPAMAEIGESTMHKKFRAWIKKHQIWGDGFRDLPPESFAEMGTNISTVILELRKER